MGVEMTRASPVSPTAFHKTLTLPQRGDRATSRLQASRDLLAAAGAGSWREVKWIGEAEAGFSWTTGDAHEWSSRAVSPPPSPVLTNVLNSGIAPRGPCTRH